MRGQDPQLCRSPRLDTSCERRVIVRNFLLKYVEFSHMTRFRCMKTFGWVGILLLGVFVTRVASAAPAITPDSGPIGIAVTITGEGFGKFVSTRDNAVLFGKNKRSEEHTSELQSLAYLVCRLLLEKKKKIGRRLRT